MPMILLVEDDENSYDMLGSRLEKNGYEIDLATTGTQALEKIEAGQHDLILMDIRLPDIDGYEVTKHIRNENNSKVPIIALTAHALEEDSDKALEAGCDDYHSKPVAFSQLMRQMEQLMEEGEVENN